MTCIASIFQSISIDFCLFLCIILYGRNVDRYRAILYSTNGLGEYGNQCDTACYCRQKDWIRTLYLLVVFTLYLLSVTLYCTVQYTVSNWRWLYKIPIVWVAEIGDGVLGTERSTAFNRGLCQFCSTVDGFLQWLFTLRLNYFLVTYTVLTFMCLSNLIKNGLVCIKQSLPRIRIRGTVY